MHADRLLKLAKFLETKVPAQDFDMNYWCNGEKPGCGVAACAAGWATQIPAFKKLGLHITTVAQCDANFNNFPADAVMIYFPDFEDTESTLGNDAFDVLAQFFEISHGESIQLFDPEAYWGGDEAEDPDNIKPQDVAKRIREFVNSYKIAQKNYRSTQRECF